MYFTTRWLHGVLTCLISIMIECNASCDDPVVRLLNHAHAPTSLENVGGGHCVPKVTTYDSLFSGIEAWTFCSGGKQILNLELVIVNQRSVYGYCQQSYCLTFSQNTNSLLIVLNPFLSFLQIARSYQKHFFGLFAFHSLLGVSLSLFARSITL